MAHSLCRLRDVKARLPGPGRWSLIVLLALGCSSSSESGGGCGSGSTAVCEINPTSTACGDLITIECFEGATPDADDQCEKALEQGEEAIFCCTNPVEGTEDDTEEDPPVVGGGGA